MNDVQSTNAGNVSLWRMFTISIAALYLELFLIRWAGTEVRVFAYVQNLVLVTCFLGFGVGCLRSDKPDRLISSLKDLLVLAVIVSFPVIGGFGQQKASVFFGGFMYELSNFLTLSPDAALWGFENLSYSPHMFLMFSILAVFMVALLLGLIASIMVPMGQWIGYCFDRSPDVVKTYTANLAGSLVGTWLLVILSMLYLPPGYWVALAIALVLVSAPLTKQDLFKGICLMLVTTFVLVLGQKGTAGSEGSVYWSPYQKLTVMPKPEQGGYVVRVNDTNYMSMASTTKEFQKKNPAFAAQLPDSVYDSPFRFAAKTDDVLIVGAGAGNDASAALRQGAKHVDAVEIDPMIYKLGKRLHPDHPYDSPKVNVVINDARNFMRTTKKRYDVIIFGLLDSHTGYSGYSNLRVDNYVYTKDAFAQARRLLKPDGILALKFEVRPPWLWIGQRFYRTLSEVFGREPVTYYVGYVTDMVWSGSVFLESDNADLWSRAKHPDLKKFIAAHPAIFKPSLAEAPAPATDDWPYSYNQGHFIPRTYLTVSAILLVIALFMVRSSFAVREKATWTPFLLGAGFMLMETQLVSRLTLYFGTTWIVNSIAISAVLLTLVLANLVVEAAGKKTNGPVFYIVLVISILANYFIPWERLPYSSWATGLMLSGAYATSIFMAGLIFTSTFAQAPDKSKTLGANVIGAVAGGLSQNASFIFGLKALLPMAALCYVGAALFGKAKAA
ncbi:MAG TPA: hypothetical protein VL625_06730 [Patescibacteria group bacterium]|nr:hypothetical protein [Patescibacteria group bacterium]